MEASTSSHLSLLENRFAPTTFCAGALEAPLDVVLEADAEWRRAIGRYDFRAADGALDRLLAGLDPLSSPVTRHLWIATSAPGWTAYFDNSIGGSDPWPTISFLSERIGCRGLLVSSHPEVRGKWPGQLRFDLFGQEPVDELNVTRALALTNRSGRWTWETHGEPLPFETTDAYVSRKVADRLTPELVLRYAQAIGPCLDREAFYGTRGCFVDHRSVDAASCRYETSDEARRRVGLAS